MSSIGQVGDGNLLLSSVAIAPVTSILPPVQAQYAQFELGNAAILAASVGLGSYVDVWA